MKKLNQHVMTAKFRDGLTKVYQEALEAIGIKPESVKPHIIGTATVIITDAERVALRAHYGGELIELSPHSNSGAIEISLPEGAQYLTDNRPTMTQAEREAKGKGTGTASERKAQAEARRIMRETLRQQLAEIHGIDLDADEEDSAE